MTAGVARQSGAWFLNDVADVIGRASPFIGAVIRDSAYVVNYPRGTLAPLLAFMLGASLALAHLGGDPLYTTSLFTMAILAGAGGLGGGGIGVAAWLGFITVDCGVYQLQHLHPGMPPAPFLLALALCYAVLFQLLALTPALATWLRLGVARFVPTRPGRVLASIALQAALQGALAWQWTLTTPILIRPLATWQDLRLPARAVQPLLTAGLSLALVAAVGGALRAAAEAARPPHRSSPARPSAGGLMRGPLGWAVRAAVIAFFLSGVIDTFTEGLIVWLAVVSIYVVSGRLYSRRSHVRNALVAVPIALRIAAAALIAFPLAQVLVPAAQRLQLAMPVVFGQPGISFFPVVVGAIASLAAVILVLPEATAASATARVR